MIDFHTHILPGIDDGAKSLEESLSLLKMEQEQGVDTIVLTPHYFHERQSLDAFLQQRNTAYEQLRHAAEREKISINFHLGAEVRLAHGWRAKRQDSFALAAMG